MTAEDAIHARSSTLAPGASVDLAESLFASSGSVAAPATGAPPRLDGPPSRRRTGGGRRRRRIIPFLAALVIVAVAIAAVTIVRGALSALHPATADYVGTGTGAVVVQVKAGQDSADIAATLKAADVVESTQAFTTAAGKSGRSQDFTPGFFTLRHHMSGAAAVSALLDPATHLSSKVTIPEGTIELQVLALLSRATKLSPAKLAAASKQLRGLGIPAAFGARSAEGFLFPDTYDFDPGITATDALQQMTSEFQSEMRKLNFPASAKALKLTPYQLLTVASMIEGEVKFAADRPKVARVVLNRLAKKQDLQFDSTSAYGLKLEGKDPATVTYKENSPYNTRNRPGLPPTPIGNPGEAALRAAQHPAAGNWLYFVSKDAAGHLYFTNDYNLFLKASQTCKDKHWGCT